MTSPGAALSAMRKDRVVTCIVCGKTFTAKDTRAMYCSNRCKQEAKYKKNKLRKLDKDNGMV